MLNADTNTRCLAWYGLEASKADQTMDDLFSRMASTFFLFTRPDGEIAAIATSALSKKELIEQIKFAGEFGPLFFILSCRSVTFGLARIAGDLAMRSGEIE